MKKSFRVNYIVDLFLWLVIIALTIREITIHGLLKNDPCLILLFVCFYGVTLIIRLVMLNTLIKKLIRSSDFYWEELEKAHQLILEIKKTDDKQKDEDPASVKIEYFHKGKSLAVSHIKTGSNQADRELLAQSIGISVFDEFILDDGRVRAVVTGVNGFVDDYHRIWTIENK